MEEIQVAVQNKSFSQLLIDLLLINKDLNKFFNCLSFKIGDKHLSLLRIILDKAPHCLDKIVDKVKIIVGDNVIDMKDIPNFILLVNELYLADFKNLLTVQNVSSMEVIGFIQLLVKLVIDLDYVKVDNKKSILDLIDASGSLLAIVIEPIKKNIGCNCFPCIKK